MKRDQMEAQNYLQHYKRVQMEAQKLPPAMNGDPMEA
jgi:hypothetical protein